MSTTRVNIGDPTRASDINKIIPLVVRKSTSYTITDTGDKQVYLCMPSTGSTITLTLPTLLANKQRELIFIHGTTATGKVKIEGEGVENISGSTAIYLNAKYDRIELIADSVEWRIL